MTGKYESAVKQAMADAGMIDSKYESKVVRVLFKPVGDPIFSDNAITIEIADEGSGEFVNLRFAHSADGISIDPSEWHALRAAIDEMVSRCEL